MPGLIESNTGSAPPEVMILQGEVPLELGGNAQVGPDWQLARGRFILRITVVVRRMPEAGTTVTWQYDGGTAPESRSIRTNAPRAGWVAMR